MSDELAHVGERPPVPMSIGRVLGILTALALVVFWIYVFANRGTVDHADEFDDPQWLAQAEAVCADRQAAIAELPGAASVDNAVERGELVALGTVELEQMVEELRQLGSPANEKGAATVPRWLDDYELFLQDRRNWTDILLTGEDPPLLISGTADGVRVTDLLTTFAEVNAMPSCAPSPDAG